MTFPGSLGHGVRYDEILRLQRAAYARVLIMPPLGRDACEAMILHEREELQSPIALVFLDFQRRSG